MDREHQAFEAMVADGYGELGKKLEELLYELDPLGVCMPGGPNPDEYQPEARTILPRLKTATSPEDVAWIMRQEFDRWFGSWSVRPERLRKTADAIWQAWSAEQRRRRHPPLRS